MKWRHLAACVGLMPLTLGACAEAGQTAREAIQPAAQSTPPPATELRRLQLGPFSSVAEARETANRAAQTGLETALIRVADGHVVSVGAFRHDISVEQAQRLPVEANLAETAHVVSVTTPSPLRRTSQKPVEGLALQGKRV